MRRENVARRAPRRRRLLACGVVAGTVMTGCSLQPAYVRPTAPIPATWADSAPDSAVLAAPSVSYRDVFQDSALRQIIIVGLAENRDLRIAMANVAAVRAQYRIQQSEQWPAVTAGLGASYGKNGSTPANGATPRGRIEQYTANVGVGSLEIDLFGRLRSLNAAALNEYFASRAGAYVARITLVSAIANSYLALAADQSRLAIARETEKNAIRSVELTEARHRGGIASLLDVRQAQTILAQARADIANGITTVTQDRNALDLLVGARVDDALLPPSLDGVDSLLRQPPTNFSTSVLLRRPDIAQAEFALKAANARIGAARAALFPTLSLGALLSWTGGTLGTVFKGTPGWSVDPSLDATIFNAGLSGAISYTKAERDLLVAQYEKTIQTAFREVADALARQETIGAELDANTTRVSAATDSYNLSYARYRGGLDAFLSTLDAQRQLYAAQQLLITTRQVRASNIVTLYQTIAGDAWVADSVTGSVAGRAH